MSKPLATLDSVDPTAREILLAKAAVTRGERLVTLRQDIAGLFAAFPEVVELSLVAYTPWGFNDGDPVDTELHAHINGRAAGGRTWPDAGCVDGIGVVSLDEGADAFEKGTEEHALVQAVLDLPAPSESAFAVAGYIKYAFGNLHDARVWHYKRQEDGSVALLTDEHYSAEY